MIAACLRANAETTEKAIEFMEPVDDGDDEMIDETRADVELWRGAADLIEQLEAEVEEGRARAARFAEEIWRMTGEKAAIL